MSKFNTKQHIKVELHLDNPDLTAAESKATYEEIKAYVLEKHVLKVSSLYISQVKRKCGIIECKNYNKPKSGKCETTEMSTGKGSGDHGGIEVF